MLLRSFIAVLPAALVFVFAAGGQAAAPARRSYFLSPWPGTRVTDGEVLLSGHLPPEYRNARFFLNGKPLEGLTRVGTSFQALFTPGPGDQVVEVRDGGIVATLSFAYGPGGSKPVYRFHQAVRDGDCAECHPVSGQKPASVKARVCLKCHGVWEKQSFVHGPVGAEECVVCHDPHGSAYPHLERHEVREGCFACHDQGASKDHISRAQNRDCVSCHDPHGGKDRFFLKK